MDREREKLRGVVGTGGGPPFEPVQLPCRLLKAAAVEEGVEYAFSSAKWKTSMLVDSNRARIMGSPTAHAHKSGVRPVWSA